MSTRDKPTLSLDFDGVIHAYSRGWQDGEIYDSPVPGFFEWARRARERFRLVVFSSRCVNPSQALLVKYWLEARLQEWKTANFVGAEQPPFVDDFEVWVTKPPAFLSIDDRALQFRGDWSAWWLDPDRLLEFKPWTAGEPPGPCEDPRLVAADELAREARRIADVLDSDALRDAVKRYARTTAVASDVITS